MEYRKNVILDHGVREKRHFGSLRTGKTSFSIIEYGKNVILDHGVQVKRHFGSWSTGKTSFWIMEYNFGSLRTEKTYFLTYLSGEELFDICG
jgi:hypothetical protein